MSDGLRTRDFLLSVPIFEITVSEPDKSERRVEPSVDNVLVSANECARLGVSDVLQLSPPCSQTSALSAADCAPERNHGLKQEPCLLIFGQTGRIQYCFKVLVLSMTLY